MAEHNTEDARGSVPPRRGARPFVGPSGAPGQALPLLRATPTRPAPRPFVPAPGARPSLGTTPRPVPPVAPATPVAASPAVATDVAAASPALDTVPDAAPAEAPELALPEVSAPPVAPVAPVAATPAWLAAQAAPPETTDNLTLPPMDESAADRFAAFDMTWQDETAVGTPAAPTIDPSPLDVASLGSGHTDELWAADIVSEVPTAQAVEPEAPAWLMDVVDPVPTVHVTSGAAAVTAEDLAGGEPHLDAEGAAPVDESMLDGSWADVTIMPSADAIMAAGLEAADAAVNPNEPRNSWPDPLLAEYAPYVPTPATVTPVLASESAAAALDITPAPVQSASRVIEPLAESLVANSILLPIDASAADTATPTVAAAMTHESIVAASLDRLAQRVRDGQIDVSSVAPERPDAAVLAAVLAALLGGGPSSSR